MRDIMWELTVMKYLDSLKIIFSVMILLLHFNPSKHILFSVFKLNDFIKNL